MLKLIKIMQGNKNSYKVFFSADELFKNTLIDLRLIVSGGLANICV